MNKVAIVTGGSSGIGRQTALALAQKGCTVYEFSRRQAYISGVTHLPVDVTDEAAFMEAVKTVAEAEGRIDILINNAGFGISGAAEFTENGDAKRLLDVNLFGAVNGCRAVIPYMRSQGYGRIVNISSVAAPCAIPFQAWYSVSKAAVSTYTLALANEVRPFGIQVAAVMPGDIHSGFTGAREKSPVGDDIYGGRIARSVAVMERDEENGMSPRIAGQYIAGVALCRRPHTLNTVGLRYKSVVALMKLLPCDFSNYLIGKIYG